MNPLVTFGIVNCNRLHYLKCCVESLIDCTSDYNNIEIIIVDNASVEKGTTEYLNHLEMTGHHVFRTDIRDPPNEYARALNYIVEHAKGEFICPLAGDMQFIVKDGWLKEYVDFYNLPNQKPFIGCISFDAQRLQTIQSHQFSQVMGEGKLRFIIDASRPPIAGSANAMFSRENLEIMGLWDTNNRDHEGEHDSETKMLQHVLGLQKSKQINWVNVQPIIPVSAAIYTDSRGTNARIRGTKRYGDYWASKSDNEYAYYNIWNFEDIISIYGERRNPASIEWMVTGDHWDTSVMFDENGDWKKNPIRPETAQPHEWVELKPTKSL